MSELLTLFISKINYWVYIALMMIGLYAIVAKNNLVKKVIGMNIFRRDIIFHFHRRQERRHHPHYQARH